MVGLCRGAYEGNRTVPGRWTEQESVEKESGEQRPLTTKDKLKKKKEESSDRDFLNNNTTTLDHYGHNGAVFDAGSLTGICAFYDLLMTMFR